MKACPSCQASYPTSYTHCPRDGTPLVEATAWGEGTVVRGKYRILAKVGQGGMATVYKAVHTRFGEVRALKVMNPELAGDQAFVKRFMHEAVLTRKLQHPNAVRVEDIDEAEDGRPFIVMEYIEGRSLRDVIQTEAPIPVGRVCPIIIQVASALDAAHRLGIVHRDVKPANIVLLTQSSPSSLWAEPQQAKVLDFGIAKAKEARLDDSIPGYMTLTDTGRVIGTPAYMSPEQARGIKGDQLDGRSDLYSLGVVMYQMLAGDLPFKADTSMEWILAHVRTPPKSLGEARRDLQIPQAIVALVMRCLEKDRELCPGSAAALIDELKRAEQEILSPAPTRVFQPGVAATGSAPAATTRGAQDNRPALSSPQVEWGAAPAASASGPSWAWAGWAMVAVSVVLIAVAILFWRMYHRAPPASTISPARTEVQNTSGSSQPGAPGGGSGASTSPPAGVHAAPDASGTSQAGDSASSSAPASPEVPNNPSTAAPTSAPKAGPTTGGETVPGELLAEALRRQRVADAVGRAEDDEGQGRFEEALKEYQQAAKLDPSNAKLKRNIQRLQSLIKTEKELIQ